MSHSDQPKQNGSTFTAQAHVEHVADLDRLIPQDISNNKRAVIKRLVELYKLDAKSERFSESRSA